MMEFTYLKQPPKRYTFEQPKLKRYVEKWCKGKTLNLFAGKVILSCDEYRVDIDKEAPSNHHGDALEFVKNTELKFDTVILDPPYNIRKGREKYNGKYIGHLKQIRNELSRIINRGGRVITLGYETSGMSQKRGFEKVAICIVNHGGDHSDTLCVVEEKKVMQL